MNYRHHYHAGNFADVFKHIGVLDVLRRLQAKDKGILVVDTHAGRGAYDLALADQGDRLERQPEHPEGWGLLKEPGLEWPLDVRALITRVREYQAGVGKARFYPGSPRLLAASLRAQDRLVLCEKHPEEAQALREEMAGTRRASVLNEDGYRAVLGQLPPPERRALVLIDPPFESQREVGDLVDALGSALRRWPAATVVVWYPLSGRVPAEALHQAVARERWAPAWVAELTVRSPEKEAGGLWGSGLLILNPPWQMDQVWGTWLGWLTTRLAQGPGAAFRTQWIVAE